MSARISLYDYQIKNCRYCGQVFKPVSGAQKVCFVEECRHQRILDKSRRKHKRNRLKEIGQMRRRYYERKETFLTIDTKPCDCGCATLIPTFTAQGRQRRFAAGHHCKGKTYSPEYRMKLSLAHKGQQVSKEHIQRMLQRLSDPEVQAKRLKNLRVAMTVLHNNPEYERKRMLAMNRKPNGPERKVLAAVTKHQLPLKYVGDGSVIINRLNPDFISTNEPLRAVEVFGNYWHSLGDRPNRSEEGRKRALGIPTLVLWEKEINQESLEEIASKIQVFLQGVGS